MRLSSFCRNGHEQWLLTILGIFLTSPHFHAGWLLAGPPS